MLVTRLVFLLPLVCSVACDNILGYFTMPFHSHHRFHGAIVNILLDLGHNVTVITELPFEPHENLTEIRLESEEAVANMNFVKMSEEISGVSHFISHLADFLRMFINQVKNQKFQNLIRAGRKNHFDLIIVEHYFFHPIFVLAEVYDCPIIMAIPTDAPSDVHSWMGNGANPITDPDPLQLPYVASVMMFGERILSTLLAILFTGFIDPISEIVTNFCLRAYFPNVTASIADIKDRIVLLVTRTHPAMGFIRPSTNLIQVGFLHIEPPKPLIENDLKRFLDASQHGVIYMSFGSIARVQDMRASTVNVFVNVFKSLKFDVVWAVGNATIPNKPDNVFTLSWVPQADLLAHPSIKLFITHAGLVSVTEAIDRSVPMVMFPLCGDQQFNSAQMQRRGVGIELDLHSITEKILIEAIEECLKPEYKSNIEHLRELVYDQPMTCREKAVWWLQHVLKHKGADHLKYPGRKVPFYQKYCIDIILFLGVAILAAIKIIEKVKKYVRSLKNSFGSKPKQQ